MGGILRPHVPIQILSVSDVSQSFRSPLLVSDQQGSIDGSRSWGCAHLLGSDVYKLERPLY